MDISAQLQKEFGDHNPEEIEAIDLDDLFHLSELTPAHKQAIEKYKSLIRLSLSDIGLTNFSNFPSLPGLQILELKNNKLDGKNLDQLVKLYPLLYKIKLTNNLIEDYDVFKQLEGSRVRKIEVNGNPFTKRDKNYREKLFKMYPKILIIDDYDKYGQELDTSNYSEESEDDDYDEDDEGDNEESEEIAESFEGGDSNDEEENEESEESQDRKKKRKD